MKYAMKGALLSGLVFPGLGQLVLRQYRRGAILVLAVLISLSVIVVVTVQQALDMLEMIEAQGEAIDINAISSAAVMESAQSVSPAVNMLILFVIVCWIAGTVDAYRIGKKIDLQQGRRS